jgi:hypothetical protein
VLVGISDTYSKFKNGLGYVARQIRNVFIRAPEKLLAPKESPLAHEEDHKESALPRDESVFSRDESALTRNESALTRNESALARDESVLARDASALVNKEPALADEESALAHEGSRLSSTGYMMQQFASIPHCPVEAELETSCSTEISLEASSVHEATTNRVAEEAPLNEETDSAMDGSRLTFGR